MFGKKIYGHNRKDICPFCGKQATTKNSQGYGVCLKHKNAVMEDMRCACGEYLDIKEGKYGLFFLCMSCGPMSQSKAFEINDIKDISQGTAKRQDRCAKKSFENNESWPNDNKQQDMQRLHQKKKDMVTIRSDDPLYFD